MDLQICQYIIYKSTIYLLIKRISLIIIIIIFLWIATITYFNHVYMPSMECIITPETFKKVKITAEKKKNLHYLPRYFGIKCKPRHQNK